MSDAPQVQRSRLVVLAGPTAGPTNAQPPRSSFGPGTKSITAISSALATSRLAEFMSARVTSAVSFNSLK